MPVVKEFSRMGILQEVRTLSRLMTGFQNWFWSLWKYLIPTLPK